MSTDALKEAQADYIQQRLARRRRRTYVARLLVVIAVGLTLGLALGGCNYDLASVTCADPNAKPVITRNADGEVTYEGCQVTGEDGSADATGEVSK